MTAREDATWGLIHSSDQRMPYADWKETERLLVAASDIWEPLAKDLFEICVSMLHCIDRDDVGDLNIETIRCRLSEHSIALPGVL